MATLESVGMDGSTLLGFLASIGSLRLLTEAHASARLRFEGAGDRAVFDVPELPTPEEIVRTIAGRLQSSDREDELRFLGEAGCPGALDVAELGAMVARARGHKGISAFLAGLVSDDLASPTARETTLCAANGAGHQNMFMTLRDLRRLVTEPHVRSTLMEHWTFRDRVPATASSWMGTRKPTLRWDEGSERVYALRFRRPSADPEAFRTQLGAYALAAAALPCFPVVPTSNGGRTIFTTPAEHGQYDFHWVLWRKPASLAAAMAIMASGEALTDPAAARRRGVYRLFKARRLTLDRGRLAFAPAEAIW